MMLHRALLFLAFTSPASAQQISASAQAAFQHAESAGLISTTDTPPSGAEGSARLEIMPGNNNVQQSNFNWRSFKLFNTGGKRIAAAFIDVTDSIFSDVVFDADGSGGDDVSKGLEWNWGTSETNPVSPENYQEFWLPARSSNFDFSADFDPNDLSNVNNLFVDQLSDSTIGSASGGFRGELLVFESFGPGLIDGDGAAVAAEFSGDMDPNSIAGLNKGTVDIDAGWDVGGVSGAELINSVVTVLFGDGSTASGTVAADGSQAGSVAIVSNDLVAAPGLSVNGVDAGGAGTYSGTTPAVVVTAGAGTTVRVSMVEAFDPVSNTQELLGDDGLPLITAAALVEARLKAQYPAFPVSNAKAWHHFDVDIPDSGALDISGLFESNDGLAVAFTAVILDDAGYPVSFTADPIHLLFAASTDAPTEAPSIATTEAPTATPTIASNGLCPSSQKLDGEGYCVMDWCEANFECRADLDLKRRPNRTCYDNIGDCTCNQGYFWAFWVQKCCQLSTWWKCF